MADSLTVKGRQNSKNFSLGGIKAEKEAVKWRNIVKISTFRRWLAPQLEFYA